MRKVAWIPRGFFFLQETKAGRPPHFAKHVLRDRAARDMVVQLPDSEPGYRSKQMAKERPPAELGAGCVLPWNGRAGGR